MKSLPKITCRQLFVFAVVSLLLTEGFGQIHFFVRKKGMFREAKRMASSLPSDPLGVEPRAAKAPSFHIVISGGSAAAGFGEKDTQSWSGLLEKEVRRLLSAQGREVQVTNIAGGSFTSADDYVNIHQRIDELKPDLVIVYNGWNDIAAFTGSPGWITKNTESRLSGIGENLGNYSLKVRLAQNIFLAKKIVYLCEEIETIISGFYHLRESIKNTFIYHFQKISWGPRRKAWQDILELSRYQDQKPLSFEEVLADTRIDASYLSTYPKFKTEMKALFKTYYFSNMNSLAKTLEAHRVPALFVVQPDLAYKETHVKLSDAEEGIAVRLLGRQTPQWKLASRDFYPLVRQLAKKAALAHGVHFLDLSAFAFEIPGESIFVDTVHYNPSGSEMIFKRLLNYLMENRLIPHRRSQTMIQPATVNLDAHAF